MSFRQASRRNYTLGAIGEVYIAQLTWMVGVVWFPIGVFAILWANLFRKQPHDAPARGLKHHNHDNAKTIYHMDAKSNSRMPRMTSIPSVMTTNASCLPNMLRITSMQSTGSHAITTLVALHAAINPMTNDWNM
jgi:hypothetical protein